MFVCRADSRRSLTGRYALFLTLVLSLLAPSAASAQVLELVEVKLPESPPPGFSVSSGAISWIQPNWSGQFTWNVPPQRVDASGFTLTLNAAAQATAGNFNAETSASSDGFTFEPAEPRIGAFANAGESKSQSMAVKVTPIAGLSPGSMVTLNIGASFYTGVDYIYRVADFSVGGDDGGSDDGGGDGNDRRLAASLDCPSSIIISELPSLNCHIVITSWRHSADPVEVILPDALDAYGNHANGIQLLQAAGSQDVFNWTAPYLWGMFVFACPSQDNTGANCFGSVTAPSLQSVNIIVRQGSDEVQLRLDINAIPRPGGGQNTCGFVVGSVIFGKWIQTGGQTGVLGCAIGNEQETGRSPSGAEAHQVLFQGGVIVLHGGGRLAGAAFEVHGSIAARYLGMGGTASWLGLPVSDEYDMPGGRRSDFEGGYIAWDTLTGGSIAMRDGSATVSFEPDTNRAGSDFTSFEAIGDRMEICRDACAAESSCVAYTYVRPGLQGPRGVCWLKSSVPEAHVEGCCISGFKR